MIKYYHTKDTKKKKDYFEQVKSQTPLCIKQRLLELIDKEKKNEVISKFI